MSIPIMSLTDTIYELLAVSPRDADREALVHLSLAQSQEECDHINWARGYALVELRRFDEAFNIWQEIFQRTSNHRALHQMGYVERCAGKVNQALEIFQKEKHLISIDDRLSVAVNLYELSFCNLLLGKLTDAKKFLDCYEKLGIEESDLIERGCFFRLKGDIHRSQDTFIAKVSYDRSLKFFIDAGDIASTNEIMQRISTL